METVEEFRERFRAAPLGRWVSEVEFGPFAVDMWEFYRDGSGKRVERSGSGGGTALFEWQPHAERVIRFREVQWQGEGEEPSQDDAEDEDDEPIRWRDLAYDFKELPGVLPRIVMFEAPEHPTWKFSYTLSYLRFEGELEA